MKEQLEKWKEMLKTGGKNRWAVFLLAGLLLLVISLPNRGGTRARLFFRPRRQTRKRVSQAEDAGGRDWRQVLSRVQRRGEDEGSGDFEIRRETSGGEGQHQGAAKTAARAGIQEENTVYEKNGSGQEKPYVSETMEPEVSGVLVVAEGGDDPVTVREITEAVQALFGIEAHKIKVMKMD